MSFKTVSSTFGHNIRITIAGGSHEPEISVVAEGFPADEKIDLDMLQTFMSRRAPGNSIFATPRKEADVPVFETGFRTPEPEDSRIRITDGRPLKAVIRNTNTRSSDYSNLRDIPRPAHADFTAAARYGNSVNMSGGGPFSARMTAPLCIAGGMALQILERKGIHIGAHIYSVGAVKDLAFNPVSTEVSELQALKALDFPVLDHDRGEAMKQEILAAKKDEDSVGGIIEAIVLGLPKGHGGAMYDGIESRLAPVLFGIPAVKGVEFGNGFAASTLRGSKNNDAFIIKNDEIRTATNNHGGILGGISSGMPVICRLAFKPTPSIGREQQSVSMSRMENAPLKIQGRHDPCVAVRAVPIVEAALAAGILDLLLENPEF